MVSGTNKRLKPKRQHLASVRPDLGLACSSCESSQRSIVDLLNRTQLIPKLLDTWPKIESSEHANSNKTICPGRWFNLLYRDLILAVSKNCWSKWTALPTAAGGIPALKGKSSGCEAASPTSTAIGASSTLSSMDVRPSAGVDGDLLVLAAFSALTNVSNLALHLLLCLPFISEHALQSGVAPKRIMRSRVIYSCRTAGGASDGRLENGTSFGRYSAKLGSLKSANAASAAACKGMIGSPGGTYTSSHGTDKATA